MSEPENPLDQYEHVTGRELQQMELEPPGFLVENILPEGMSLLVAKPKSGKTMMALNISVAIASGKKAFDEIPVEQGRVLFLALEGGLSGFQNRIDRMLSGEKAPSELHIVKSFPQLGDGALEELRDIINYYHDVRLVVIDTLILLRGKRDGSDLVAEDYEDLGKLSTLSEETGVSILAIHHTKKGTRELADPLDAVSGTTGVTAAVENILLLQEKHRRDEDATLKIRSRELGRKEVSFSFDRERKLWTPERKDWQRAESQSQQDILDVLLEEEEALGPKAVSERVESSHDSVRHLMPKMHKNGVLRKVGDGRYEPAPPPP